MRLPRTPLLALLLTGTLLGCGGTGAGVNVDGADRDRAVLRVGQLRNNLQPMLEAAGVMNAEMGGELGYEIEWANFESGPQAIEAENAGAVDLAYMADTPPIFAQAAEVDVRIVALTRALQGGRYVAVIVADDSGIDHVVDLEDKRVATVPGTVTQYLLLRALEQAGLGLDDVHEVSLQAPEAITALGRGDVDAAVLVDPSAATALERGGARVLLSGEQLLSGSNTFVAHARALEDDEKEAAIGDFLRRAQRALEWTLAHPAEWAEVYGDLNRLPPTVARQTTYRSATRMVPIDGRAVQVQQQQADAFAEIGLLRSPVRVDAEFDLRYNDLLFPG